MNFADVVMVILCQQLLYAYRLGMNANYQYYNDQDTIDFTSAANYQSGVWFKYQPLAGLLQVGMISLSESNSSLLFYNTYSDSSNLFSISYLNINYEQQQILLKSKIKGKNKIADSSLEIDPRTIDGLWIYHYYLIQKRAEYFNIQIGYINQNVRKSQIFNDIELFQSATLDIFFGGGLDKFDFNEHFFLTYFLGIIEIQIGNGKNSDPISVFYTEWTDGDISSFQQKVIEDTHFQSGTFLQVDSLYNIYSNFQINFWIKLDQYVDGISYIFHISGILANNYKDKTGGNIASLYYQVSEQESQLIFGYYSYNFPYFSETQDIYKNYQNYDFTLISQKWYMITLQYVNQSLILFIYNMELNVKFLHKLENINQFKSPMFYIYVGGDFTSQSTIPFTISLFTLKTEIDNVDALSCHFSCLSCDGPYSSNCLACSDQSGREYFQGKCLCNVEFLEINQKNCYDFSEYKLIEISKQQKENLCPYGYFIYQDDCFQWYNSKNIFSPSQSQEFYIFCTECIINWRNWIFNPVCTLTIQSNYETSGTYIQILDSEQYFTFNQGELFLCQDCVLCLDSRLFSFCYVYKYQHLSQPAYINCLNGLIYSKDTQDCIQDLNNYYKAIKCQQYCGKCNSVGRCMYCNDPQTYYLSIDLFRCLECSIKFCKYCFQVQSNNKYDLQSSTLYQNIGDSHMIMSDDVITYCALCYDGYTFNFTNGECEKIILPPQCLQAYVNNNETICLISISDNFKNNQISITDCSAFMTNCLQCIHNKNQRLFCLKCKSGYYVDTNIGICKSCYDLFDSTEVKECYLINLFYQDQWMIDIQPFYNSFFVGQQIYLSFASFRSFVNIKECQNNYRLYNWECHQTSISYTCLTSGYAEFQYYCQSCKINKEQQSYSYDPTNLYECLTCPYQCKYCKPRAQTDIQLINPDFIGNSDFSNYCIKQFTSTQSKNLSIYYDTEYMYLTICKSYHQCQLTLQFEADYPRGIVDVNLIKYMNMRKIAQIIGLFNLTNQIARNIDLSHLLQIKQNVFSITKVTANLTGLLYTFDNIFLTGIDELIFENTSILIFIESSSQNYIAIIMNSNSGTILKMKDVSITISTAVPLYSKNFGEIFQLNNMHLIQLSNTILLNMFLEFDFIIFESKYLKNEIKIENMILQNLTFSNSSLLRLNGSNQASVIMFKNITIKNCTFIKQGALITLDQNYFFQGTIIFQNITIQYSTFVDNSSLFNIKQVISLVLSDMKIEQTFIINSNLLQVLLCENLSINSLIIYNSTLKLSNILQISGNIDLQVTNLSVQSNEIIQSSIINMKNSESSNVSMSILTQAQISVNEQQSIQNPCFYDLNGNFINLNNFSIEKSTIYKDFCLYEFKLVNVKNVTIFSKNKISINPIAKCLELEFYHNSFLQIDNFQVVNVKNLTASNLLFVNSSLLQFLRQVSSQEQQINLEKVKLSNNRILKLTVNLISTLIYIYSDSKLSVNLIELQIENNWINHYLIDFEIVSPGILYVVADSINLFSSSFQSNLITNTSESIIFFNSILININNVVSDNTKLTLEQFYESFDPLIQNNQVFNKIFPIQSQGGLFSISCQTLQFTNSFIFNSVATIGGGILIQVQLEGNIYFKNNTFINTTAKSQTTLQGIGGCIYLDASSSSLQFYFINNTIISSNSKYIGGVIFIQPSKVFNYIKLSNLMISDVHSLKGALLYCLFPDESTNNTIFIQKIQIEINEQSFKDYVIDQQFTEYDDQFWPAQTGIIHIINSAIVIIDIMYFGSAFQPLLFLYFSQCLKISNLRVVNILQYSNSMINLNKYNTLSSQNYHFLLEKIILSNIQVLYLSGQTCPELTYEHFVYIFCFQNQNTIKIQKDDSQECITQQKMALINNDLKQLVVINNLSGSIRNKISDIRFNNISCPQCKKGIFSILQTNLKLQFVLMNSNSCGETGCLSIIQNNSKKVFLMDSVFVNNSATLGGAIFGAYANIYLYGTLIINNSATYGGGIYFISDGNQLISNQTKIINNLAEMSGGGIMMLNYSITANSTLQILNNFAKNGVENIFSKIQFLKLNIYEAISTNKKISENIDFAEINNSTYIYVPSGQTLTQYEKYDEMQKKFKNLIINPRILAYNQLGEQLLGMEEQKCIVYQNTKLSQENRIKLFEVPFNSLTNNYDLSSLIITFNPYQQNKSSFIQIQVSCSNQIDENYTLLFYFRTFFCQPGEYLSNDACQKCDSTKGQYSVKANQTECYKYDSNSMKSITSSELNLNIGYWRQHKEINIPVFCYKAYQNCLGGWGTGDSTCSKGNIGALCEECDIYNIRGDGKYQKQQGQSCSLCGEIAGIIIKVFFITIWTLGSIWVTVQSTSNSNEQLKKLKMMTKFYEIVFKQNQDKAGSLIKMLANYCQIILALKTFQLNLVINIPNIISPISDPTGSFSYSFDCYLSENSVIQIIYVRIIWMICLTFSYFLVYILLYLIYCQLLKTQIRISTITTSVLYLFTYTQPSIINELVQLMAIKRISDIDYIKANLSYQYFTTKHFYWMIIMVIPLIVLYVLFFPGVILYKLFMSKTKLNRKQVREIWGYMYYEYQKENYYWEIIKMIQRVTIIVILNYLDSDVSIKAILICFIVFIYHKLMNQLSPYCLTYLNNFEKHHIFFCAIIIMLGDLLFQIQSYENTAIELLLQLLIFLLVIHIFVNIISQIYQSYIIKYNEKIDLVRNFILAQFPKISNNCPMLATKLKSQKKVKQNARQRFQKIKVYLKLQVSQKKQYLESQRRTDTEIESQNQQTQFTQNFDGQVKLLIQHNYQESLGSMNYRINENIQSNSLKRSQEQLPETQTNLQ